jgi:hypothetical protein
MKYSLRNLSLTGLITLAFGVGCADNPSTYSILIEQEDFLQAPTQEFNSKVDILWVVDSSGSMEPYQDNLAANFNSFISSFASKGFDYHMAVIGTDAWKRETNYDGHAANETYFSSADLYPTNAKYEELGFFRDGDIYGGEATCTGTIYYSGGYKCTGTWIIPPGERSGVYMITKNTPDVLDVFRKNIKVGIRGDGSERGFQSLRAALRINEDGTPGYGGETHTALNEFRRSNAFLSVIFVADENDGSTKKNGSGYSNNAYVTAFMDMMDAYTESAPENRRYNVSSIVMINKNTCTGGAHESASNGTKYIAIAEATNGVVADICNPNFSEDLTMIAENVVALVSRFQLSREPILSSIVVKVSGVLIPQDDINGWSYFVENGVHFIGLNGNAIPTEGAPVSITYDPVTVKE